MLLPHVPFRSLERRKEIFPAIRQWFFNLFFRLLLRNDYLGWHFLSYLYHFLFFFNFLDLCVEGGDLRGTSMQLLEVVTAGVRILELGTAGAELVPGAA